MYEIGQVLRLRKKHACGGDTWKVIKQGVDVRLQCETCGRVVDCPDKLVHKGKQVIT